MEQYLIELFGSEQAVRGVITVAVIAAIIGIRASLRAKKTDTDDR